MRSTAPGFIIAEATGIARQDWPVITVATMCRSREETWIRSDSSDRGPGGSVQQGRNFNEAVGSMAHEFGHYLGLPDLYDTSALQESIDPEEESAGIGYWGIMEIAVGTSAVEIAVGTSALWPLESA